MPVREISPGKYRYGKTGKVYPIRAAAERQARAIHASQARARKSPLAPRHK